ncbi:MAG: AsnC family transcriptional regulator [Phycisphaeraceae bacterium]
MPPVQPSSPTDTLEPVDRELLDLLQQRFPIAPRPWAVLGEALGLPGEAVLNRVKQLKESGLIRQISAIFDTRSLGYHSTLVAGRALEAELDTVGARIGEHPGVTHNYRREAEFNLWFTFAVPPEQDLEAELAKLAERAGLEHYRALPTERTFAIGVKLAMSDKAGRDKSASPAPAAPLRREPLAEPLSERDRELVRQLQVDLPLVDRPFDAACERAGIDFDALADWMGRMRERGVMRRFAAVLRHRQAGFSANGMVCWQVPAEHIEEAGRIAAEFDAVSHCYQRPRYPDWPFNLYTMVHARSEAACEQVVQRIAEALSRFGDAPRRILYSTKEYKKTRLQYFV